MIQFNYKGLHMNFNYIIHDMTTIMKLHGCKPKIGTRHNLLDKQNNNTANLSAIS